MSQSTFPFFSLIIRKLYFHVIVYTFFLFLTAISYSLPYSFELLPILSVVYVKDVLQLRLYTNILGQNPKSSIFASTNSTVLYIRAAATHMNKTTELRVGDMFPRSLFASSGKAYTRIGDLNTEGRITEIITRLREEKSYCYNRRVVV